MTLIVRQLTLFGLVGVVQVVIDTAVLIGLTFAGFGLVPANISGRIAGASAGFFLNGTATFSHQTKRRLRGVHLTRFVIAWLALTLASTIVLYLLHKHVSIEVIWLVKPSVEVFLACISFFTSKFWIYK